MHLSDGSKLVGEFDEEWFALRCIAGVYLSDRCAPFRPVKFLGQIGLCMERRMPQMQKPTPTAEPMAYFGDSVELKR